MSTRTLACIIFVCAGLLLSSGCVSEQKYKELQAQNRLQSDRIAQLESEANTARIELDQLKAKLAESQARGGTDIDALKQQVAALEQMIEQKNQLIAQLQGKLLRGGNALPEPLSNLLQEFAEKYPDLVTFDPNSGIVRFKTDLLFTPGSDKVDPKAAEALKKLAEILNGEEGKGFDAIIAGHTDDLPIKKLETKAAHPSNWYLSAHRAIAVLNLLVEDGMASTRLSERGFGEFRPLVPNAPNHKGNPTNRRVEIYIVTKGM